MWKKGSEMAEKTSKPGFTLCVTKNGKKVYGYHSRSKRRFYNRARTINWKDKPLKVYLRVSYGRSKDVWGKYTNYYNDGDYDTKKDFWLALKAFCEDD